MAATVVMTVFKFTQRFLNMWWVCGICYDIWMECAASIFRLTDSSVPEEVLESKESEGYMGQLEEM